MCDHEFVDPDLSLTQTMVAGSAAGMSEHLVMFPADTVKTRMMSARVGWRYDHLVSTLRLISAEEGISGFYRGFLPAFLASVPSHAALFTAYEYAKDFAGQHGASNEAAQLVGALSATCVHDTVSVPFDVLKQRMQENCTKSKTMLECFRRVYSEEGVAAFTRSLPATYAMNFPNQVAHWLTYEAAKVALGKPVEERVALDFFLCGSLSGVAAAVVGNPLDIVRTRIQLGGTSYRQVARDIYSTHGVIGFWRGVVPRMLFHAPSTALTMTTYETVKRMIVDSESSKPDTRVSVVTA